MFLSVCQMLASSLECIFLYPPAECGGEEGRRREGCLYQSIRRSLWEQHEDDDKEEKEDQPDPTTCLTSFLTNQQVNPSLMGIASTGLAPSLAIGPSSCPFHLQLVSSPIRQQLMLPLTWDCPKL